MKGHAPLDTTSTPTLAAIGMAEPTRTSDAASSVEAVGSGAAMSQGAALSMQTLGAGNSFAAGLATGGEGDGEPGGTQAIGGYAAARPEEMEPESQEAFQERAGASFGTRGDAGDAGAVAGVPTTDATADDAGTESSDAAAPAAAPTEALAIDVSNKKPANDQWNRTVIGVGEEVTFWGSRDGGTWSSSAGTGSPGDDGQYEWMAPGDVATVTITYTLEGATATVRMVVLPPLYITGTLIGSNDVNQTAGLGGAGMDVKLTMGPTNVSFYNVEWLEDPGGPAQKSGYFTAFTDEQLHHNPNPNWLLMGEDNQGITDTAAYFGAPSPFSDGSFTWVIPNRFRVGGEGSGRVFWPSVQHMTMAADGTATVSKFGQSTSRKA